MHLRRSRRMMLSMKGLNGGWYVNLIFMFPLDACEFVDEHVLTS
jgi:hypothetical protein